MLQTVVKPEEKPTMSSAIEGRGALGSQLALIQSWLAVSAPP